MFPPREETPWEEKPLWPRDTRIRLYIILMAVGTGLLSTLVFGGLFSYTLLTLGLLGLGLGIRYVTADPPHKAILTRWGERKEEVKKEGLRYIIPLVEGLIPINVEAKNQDLAPETVRTPDLAPLEIPISMTWTPGSPNPDDDGKFLKNYLNKGGEKGVRAILSDIIQERVREWAFAEDEGPKTFQEAIGAKGDAAAILIKAAAGKELDKIPSWIPTTILFKYFDFVENSMKKPTQSEKEVWGEDWGTVRSEMAILTPDEMLTLTERLEERRKIINQIKTGNGTQPIEQLGITLNRLNLKDINIKPGSKLATAAEEQVKEDRERKAEETELEHVRQRIAELMEDPWNYTAQEARDIVQTERDKVERKINDIQGLGDLGRGVGEAIAAITERRRT